MKTSENPRQPTYETEVKGRLGRLRRQQEGGREAKTGREGCHVRKGGKEGDVVTRESNIRPSCSQVNRRSHSAAGYSATL